MVRTCSKTLKVLAEFTTVYLSTFLVDSVRAFAHFLLVLGVALHVGEAARLVRPHVVLGAEKVHGELAYLVPQARDVLRDVLGLSHLRWPPPVRIHVGAES